MITYFLGSREGTHHGALAMLFRLEDYSRACEAEDLRVDEATALALHSI